MVRQAEDVTQLLLAWRGGDDDALNRLTPIVYGKLRAIAGRYMRAERPDHTLSATALVHEAYLCLMQSEVDLENRAHFFALAARMMRRILVNSAAARRRLKRGGTRRRVRLEETLPLLSNLDCGVIELDWALHKLATLDRRKAEVVELLFFGGLTYDEAATALGISTATLHRDWKVAKAWLYRELESAEPDDGAKR